MARGCAVRRVSALDRFDILPAAAGTFACRTTTLTSSKSMVGVEVSSFSTTDPSDAERYLRVYATSPKWQHASDSTNGAKPFATWFASPPIEGIKWLEPIGVRGHTSRSHGIQSPGRHFGSDFPGGSCSSCCRPCRSDGSHPPQCYSASVVHAGAVDFVSPVVTTFEPRRIGVLSVKACPRAAWNELTNLLS